MIWEKKELEWQKILTQYDEVLANSKAKNLDIWFRKELPNFVLKREKFYLTKKELSTLMNWKLSFGKNRPNLQKMVDELVEQDVVNATKVGFELSLNLHYKQAIEAITKPLVFTVKYILIFI